MSVWYPRFYPDFRCRADRCRHSCCRGWEIDVDEKSAELYRKVAVAAPEKPQDRIVAAQAADELLNISGVDASVVVAPDGQGGCFASARSIGEVNVQILMEKLGGGGNRSAAAVQFADMELSEAVQKVYAAIDDYLGPA